MAWIWIVACLTLVSALAYNRASRQVWSLGLILFLLLLTRLAHLSLLSLGIIWLLFLAALLSLQVTRWRYRFITQPILKMYRAQMPTMSRTEREALAAGTVSWEGELFKGDPNWDALLALPKPQLTVEEQAFLDGPVETACKMTDDWDITFSRADLPPDLWQFLKDQGFFALIIPKKFGGKEFSAYAHSQILIKLYSRSPTVATTVGVPNSLGPAELLLHYGTEEQKNYYLPRLARGEEIPCFALTGPEAGSDASAMTDTGIVCWGEHEGQRVLGLRLNFNKRYITLAPVATVIGLAFKMHDPEHLLGDQEDLGITCALIPRDTAGMTIGRRHYPAGVAFQNGPIQGKDIFIPLEWIIGGVEMKGQGWHMLMECLAAGRAISLPASAMGGAKAMVYATGAYARIRRQFNVSIGHFEGVEANLAFLGGAAYLMDATRSFTANLIDQGAKPAIASAITKYHVTELGRATACIALDIQGGKGICQGPHNNAMGFYQGVPISITVEGANILTRCLIIFGQGVMRCHPYVFAEFTAAQEKDDQIALREFDKALVGHVNFTASNFIRTLWLSVTQGRLTKTLQGKMKIYFQQATRFSAAFALLTDIALLVYGGSLKRREMISARLGDIVSYLYMLSATLKHFQDQGSPEEDLPVVEWACQHLLYETQQSFDEILKNFPNLGLRAVGQALIFPWGKCLAKPSDKLSHKVAELLLSPTAARSRLAAGAFLTAVDNNSLSQLEDALHKVIAAEPIEKIIKHGLQDTTKNKKTLLTQAQLALAQNVISEAQFAIVIAAETARQKVIAVDDFAPDAFMRPNLTNPNSETHATDQSH